MMITAFTETFETDGNTLNGGDRYTTSIAEFIDGTNNAGNNDYFTRTEDSGATAVAGAFTNTDGFWFGAFDIEGQGNNASVETLEFTGIDISGLTDLSFSGMFAEFDPTNGRTHWDANTQVFFEVSIDGGAFTKIMQFASTSATQNNQAAALDTDLDGIGDSTVLTRDFAAFSSDITGTGATLDLRVTFENLNQNNEDFHLDNLSIIGTQAAPTAGDDAFTVAEGADLFENLLGNDTDALGNPVSILSAGGQSTATPFQVTSDGGRDGLVIFAPTGALNFAFNQLGNFDDLEAGETDTVTISYTVTDGNGLTDSAEIAVTIQGEANATTGDATDNDLEGTTADDTLIGLDGNDTLDGGAGADTMDGGAGDDIFFVDNAGDTVIEAAGEGYDRISTTVTLTLADNVEMATARGTDDIDLTGNAENNWLNGNSGNNILSGSTGNDRLQGKGGDDTLNGGEGNDNLFGNAGVDQFVFADGNGVDVIRDFEAGETMDLSATSATAFGDLELMDVASGALIDYGTGKIVLSGMTIDEVTADDFVF